MQPQETSGFQRFSNWLKQSLFVKLISIGFLILLLMIPNVMIQELIRERQVRQTEVIQEVSNSWGAPQTIIGPVLTIPYNRWVEYENGKKNAVQEVAHFLPLKLEVKGDAKHQVRQRGIFDVILYQADMTLQGVFEQPNFDDLHIAPADVLWNQAKLSVGISGMSGIKSSILLNWAGNNIRMKPGVAAPKLLNAGVSIAIPLNMEGTSYNFSVPIKINGSDYLKLEPIGKETQVNITSDWNSPSFEGNFLPDQRNITKNGFTAQWKILDLNRNYPQSWKGEAFQLGNSTFGVRFMKPVDEYAKNNRSGKYAILVIGLTFLIYFFFETIRRFHIHPFQYFLIGLAISVFYLLLLSLSEQIGFNFAYLIAAIATIDLIVIYSASILKSTRLGIQLAFMLVAIYGFIFIVLQLEDYALLAGSLGIFVALAAVMFYSRKVDWYNIGVNNEKMDNESLENQV